MASKNKVRFGLSNVYVAKLIENEGSITYGTPFRVPGARSLNISAEGDSNDFFADDINYFSQYANNGYSGDLEIAMLPDQFLTEILGQTIDTNGAISESSKDAASRFALMGEFQGDIKPRRFVFFDCTVSRPSQEMTTIESTKEPNTDTLNIKLTARPTDNKVKTVIELNDDNQAVFDNWFSAVYEEPAKI